MSDTHLRAHATECYVGWGDVCVKKFWGWGGGGGVGVGVEILGGRDVGGGGKRSAALPTTAQSPSLFPAESDAC